MKNSTLVLSVICVCLSLALIAKYVVEPKTIHGTTPLVTRSAALASEKSESDHGVAQDLIVPDLGFKISIPSNFILISKIGFGNDGHRWEYRIKDGTAIYSVYGERNDYGDTPEEYAEQLIPEGARDITIIPAPGAKEAVSQKSYLSTYNVGNQIHSDLVFADEDRIVTISMQYEKGTEEELERYVVYFTTLAGTIRDYWEDE